MEKKQKRILYIAIRRVGDIVGFFLFLVALLFAIF